MKKKPYKKNPMKGLVYGKGTAKLRSNILKEKPASSKSKEESLDAWISERLAETPFYNKKS